MAALEVERGTLPARLHGTSTILPKCSRASMRSCAARASGQRPHGIHDRHERAAREVLQRREHLGSLSHPRAHERDVFAEQHVHVERHLAADRRAARDEPAVPGASEATPARTPAPPTCSATTSAPFCRSVRARFAMSSVVVHRLVRAEGGRARTCPPCPRSRSRARRAAARSGSPRCRRRCPRP